MNKLDDSLAEEETGTDPPLEDNLVSGMRTSAWVQQLSSLEGQEEIGFVSDSQLPDTGDDTSTLEDMMAPDDDGNYNRLATNSWAYKWLLATLQSTCALQTSQTDARLLVAETVRSKLHSLPKLRNLSSRRRPASTTVQFVVDWNLPDFLRGQNYGHGLGESLAAAMVVTGDDTNAQACTCLQYMQQTWPVSGEFLLRILQSAMQVSSGEHWGKIQNGSHMWLVADIWSSKTARWYICHSATWFRVFRDDCLWPR